MKRVLATLLVTLIAAPAAFLPTSCSRMSAKSPPVSSNPNILAVQKAILPMDRGITLGGALENYRYFKNVEWKDMPLQGRNFVEVTCKFEADQTFTTLLGPDYNLSGQDHRFAKTHDLKQIEEEWRPKISKLGITFRIQINADGTMKILHSRLGEDAGTVYYYYRDLDLAVLLQMIYRSTLPVFILGGIKDRCCWHPSECYSP
jgi:hypothetical protein